LAFSGKTISNPAYFQLDGTTSSSSVKYTPYDLNPSTTIADISVTITWFRSDGSICLNPSASVSSFVESSFLLTLLDRNNNPTAGSESLYPSGLYSTPSPVSNGLFVQTFITSPASFLSGPFAPFPTDNYINYQQYPSSGYFVPQTGFKSFIGLSINNATFQLSISDSVIDNSYLCFSQFEVTVNCRARSVIFKPTLSVILIDNGPSFQLTNRPVDFQTQQYTPLQSTITFVSVTLAWTKSAIQSGTCTGINPSSGFGNRYLQNLEVQLQYTPIGGSTQTVTLVAPNSWSSQANLATQGNYFSTTFDSTSVNRYPDTLLSGRYQPYQSLSVFNGVSPWGTWTLVVTDLDNGYPTCIFGARIALSTCTDNASCICSNIQPGGAGGPTVGAGANINSIGDITGTAVFH